MPSGAQSGVGVKFYRDSSAAESSQHDWAAIAEINSISGPGMSRGTIDVTSLDSTGGYREFIASFRDSGEISLNMNFTRAGFTLLKADFEADALRDYKVTIPATATEDAVSLMFSGFVTGIPLSITLEDKITCDCTIKISGVTDYGYDSSSIFL